jgi:hypothetical protein
VYRLLIPYYDRQRTVFQLKEAALAATIGEALGLDQKTSKVAIQLKGWKRNAEINHQGDFSKVLQTVRACVGRCGGRSQSPLATQRGESLCVHLRSRLHQRPYCPHNNPSLAARTATCTAAASARMFTSPPSLSLLQPPLVPLTPMPQAPPRARARSGTSVGRLLACVGRALLTFTLV